MLISSATISELQVCIHDQRRLYKDTGWIEQWQAFDAWVNRKVAELQVLLPDQHVTSLPMSVLFDAALKDNSDG